MKNFVRLASTFSLGLLLWAVGVAAAAIIGVWAVSSMIASSSDRSVLSAEQVNAALAANASSAATASPSATGSGSPAATPTPTSTASSPTSTPSPAPQIVSYSSAAGTLSGRCTGTRAEILTVTPAQGYGIEDREDSDNGQAEVQLSNGRGDVTIQLSCSSGAPQWTLANLGHERDD